MSAIKQGRKIKLMSVIKTDKSHGIVGSWETVISRH